MSRNVDTRSTGWYPDVKLTLLPAEKAPMLECPPSPNRFPLQTAVMVAYAAAVVVVGILFERNLVPPALAAPVALVPAIPAAIMPFVLVGRLRRMDELKRKIQFDSMAFALGATAVTTLSYGFLQFWANVPAANWVWVWPVLGSFWIAGVLYNRRRYA